MATASRSESSSPTFRIWCTVPRGTHTMSSRVAWTTLPPVSSHSSRPANTTHHSSNSRCQCGRFPPPGGLAISVTSWRSSAMIRRDQGAGPICTTTAAIRVWRTLGHVVLAAWGGGGPVASSLMTIVAGDGSREVFGVGALLGFLTRRGRLVLGIVVLALADCALVNFGGRAILAAVALLLPLNLAILAWLGEETPLAGRGATLFGAALLQAGIVAVL